ncbi:putative helicase mov-10-B.1 [Dreissena polymorpha]|uniref:RNA helicase n=1 Tax=Dreissena polymorpha TaxID=45954 RepID=A0A9D4JAC6_DREPO|nr:putative helicase mov-10-B.1 [Dreissena polymorpha]KAH3800782.1 hypothetical protein DPMN_154424 [Dreissena polymorpha]
MPGGFELTTEAKRFLKFMRDKNVEDNIFKRDEVRTLYNEEFKRSRPTEYRIAFGQMMRTMTDLKEVQELGDFYVFGKDIQVLYERMKSDTDFSKKLEEWKRKARENPFFCETCGIECTSEKSLVEHQLGSRHRIHKLHVDIYLQRDLNIAIPKGLKINSQPAVDKNGFMQVDCKAGEECRMRIEIECTMDDADVVFQKHIFLWDTGVFTMYKGGSRRGQRWKDLHIRKGEIRTFEIQCKAPKDFGHHYVPLALYFVKKDSSSRALIEKEEEGAWAQDYVLRFVSLHVLGDLHEALAPTSEFRKPERIRQKKFEDTEPGEPLPEPAKNGLAGKLKPYPIPKHLYGYVNKGMTPKAERMGSLDDISLTINSEYLSKVLCTTTPRIYSTKFHHLLWIEEIQMKTDIQKYDLNGVTMDCDKGKMILKVPGLAERRPSILRGDRIYISISDNHPDDHIVVYFRDMHLNADHQPKKRIRYEGIVHKVELDHVLLGVSRKLRDNWLKGKRYDVEFSVSPSNMWVQHRAIESSCHFNDLLFPSEDAIHGDTTVVVLKPWFNIKLNPEQQTAVRNIVQGTSRPAPYIIFGPPGTGKTVTVTEAIIQLYVGQKNSRILVCCPENTAADFLMRKLMKAGPILKKDIFRMYAISRARATVHLDIWESGQHNYDEENDCFLYPKVGDLTNYRILVVTLMSCGRLVTGKFPKNHFTHIFIDEGGHAVEPECIVPITGLMDPTDKSGRAQLVIAGDPKQLGPIIRASIALNFGLPMSLMERLMNTIEMYKTKPYDERYITKLICNYRSHDSILAVPRSLFYDNELHSCGDEMILNSLLGWERLPNKEFPIIFHAVMGLDEREGNSPSWFNRDEVAQIEAYLDSLLEEKKGQKIKPSDIGIISPYRKQVDKIRLMLTSKTSSRKQAKKQTQDRSKIAVGSVEEFQGQEFNIIIISSVRSNRDSSYTEMDIIYNLGFLRNPKRFNVAVTRARSLLIVIGNPITLEQDRNWKAFIDHCDRNNAIIGQKGKLPPDHGLKANTTTFSIVPDDNPSLRAQTEDPAWERRD